MNRIGSVLRKRRTRVTIATADMRHGRPEPKPSMVWVMKQNRFKQIPEEIPDLVTGHGPCKRYSNCKRRIFRFASNSR